jgi:hypothetical protein
LIKKILDKNVRDVKELEENVTDLKKLIPLYWSIKRKPLKK